jgi:thymidylate synthase
LVEGLKNNPDSRRHIISGWNVAVLPDESLSPQQNVVAGKMALPPCHLLYQWYVAEGKLSASLYIRSNDFFLGNPYNTCSLALFTHMLAQQCNLRVGEIIISIGDCHLYKNHLLQAESQLSRIPRALPKLLIKRKPESIFEYQYEDFELQDYEPYPHIPAPIAV